jgi:hypothetical protein
MSPTISDLSALATKLAAETSINLDVRIMGEPSRQTLVIGEQVVIQRDPANAWWQAHFFATPIPIMQLAAMFGFETETPRTSIEMQPCSTGIEAVGAAFHYLSSRRISDFVAAENTRSPENAGVAIVATIPKEAVRIEDGEIHRERALSLLGPSFFDALPDGAKRWLAGHDFSKAELVFALKPLYRLSIENSAVFHYMGDFSLYAGPLSEPYQRSDKVRMPRYSRGLLMPPSGGTHRGILFITAGTNPRIVSINVREADFAANFTTTLADSLQVGVEIRWGHSGAWMPDDKKRTVSISRVASAAEDPFNSGILSKKVVSALAEAEDALVYADIEATGMGSSVRMAFIKSAGRLFFMNLSMVRGLVNHGTESIPALLYVDGKPTQITIPIRLEAHPKVAKRRLVKSSEPQFAGVLDCLKLSIELPEATALVQ